MLKYHLLLGTNLGNRIENLKTALKEIAVFGKIEKLSSVYQTAAWGKENQQAFLNQVLVIETEMKPIELLDKLLKIELELGRVRFEKWGERVIDIDILYQEQTRLNEEELTIPHPEIQNRRFTLVPLVEIDSAFVHPVLMKTQSQLLDQCPDNLEVEKLNSKPE
ncbi:MAG: 2-amino-4-hydroxy-6-hydroxymethyldihydropteridine diphosphokinase [Bacteroidetes bacterium]|nr:2-amino-4-hydroxy-6-hydroxymethyldihydropteridine diphosphokinase [Bacteroidota bacterium]